MSHKGTRMAKDLLKTNELKRRTFYSSFELDNVRWSVVLL